MPCPLPESLYCQFLEYGLFNRSYDFMLVLCLLLFHSQIVALLCWHGPSSALRRFNLPLCGVVFMELMAICLHAKNTHLVFLYTATPEMPKIWVLILQAEILVFLNGHTTAVAVRSYLVCDKRGSHLQEQQSQSTQCSCAAGMCHEDSDQTFPSQKEI